MVNKYGPVLVTGGSGYLGSILVAFLKTRFEIVIALSSKECDVRNRGIVSGVMRGHKPSYVFHLAAKADTEWCEDNFNEAIEVNVFGSRIVIEEALRVNARVVYFSSACLYPDNIYPHHEASEMKALCKYTATKLLAEQALADLMWSILNIRMRQPFSSHQHPRNILQKLAKYHQFIDEPNSMSHVEECLPIILDLVQKDVRGPVNMCNPGTTSPLKIAKQIKTILNPTMKVEEFSYQALLNSVHAVRVNSFVDCSRLEGLGYKLADIDVAINLCLKRMCVIGDYPWPKEEKKCDS